LTWTRITDSEEAAQLLPAWFGSRMIGLRGKFALHQSDRGAILLDVLLDHAGVPDRVDLAWQPKHYLGAPVPGATMATINLAHVVGAVEFVAEATVEKPDVGTSRADIEVEPTPGQLDTQRANAVSA
jgi:hypothetical protein